MGVDQFSKLRGSISLPLSLPSPPLPCREAVPSNTARGSGERCKLPQQARGRAPAANAFWVHLEPKIASGGSNVTCHIIIH